MSCRGRLESGGESTSSPPYVPFPSTGRDTSSETKSPRNGAGQLRLSDIVGRWNMGQDVNVATVESNGRTLYNGRHMGADHDIGEYRSSSGGIVLQRPDGWAVDMAHSSFDVLSWCMMGEETIRWKRVPVSGRSTPTGTPRSDFGLQPVNDFGLQPGRPSSNRRDVASDFAVQVESLLESEFCDQLARTQYPEKGPVPDMPALSGGGAYDSLLLENGGSHRLLQKLSEIFRNDPANDCGRHGQSAGTFHGYKDTYGQQVFSPEAVVQTMKLAHTMWEHAPNIIRVTVPRDGRLLVLGDTHGQLEDVLWIFFKYGVPSERNVYVFDGDIVDRGGHALEILLLLVALKRDDPKCVHIIRGNHEDETTCHMFGFRNELESKFGPSGAGGWILSMINTEVFPILPLAAVVSDEASRFKMCVLHGGIPVNVPGRNGPLLLDQLNALNRRLTTVQKDRSTMDDHVIFNVLWADPLKPGKDVNASSGRGNLFTEQDTLEFCRVNNLRALVRAHEPPSEGRGFEFLHGGKCITVFSASNYCGNYGNKGGVLICDGRSFGEHGPQPQEHMAPGWLKLSEALRAHCIFRTPASVRAQIAAQTESSDRPQAQVFQDVECYVMQLIVKHKQQLFWAFSEKDSQGNGKISRTCWKQTLASMLRDVPPVWDNLIEEWELEEPVLYVQFLHRFQIVGELKRPIDMFSAMSQLRVSISDIRADELLAGLDQDLSGTVDLQEFQQFINKWGIDIPHGQTAALYEALSLHSAGKRPVVEDILLGIALISKNPVAQPCGDAWMETAKVVGEEIAKSGQSLVSFFRRWDTDRSGFLSPTEVELALLKGLPSVGQQFSADQMQVLVHHMDAQGVANDRVSLIEFLRALGPRTLARDLSSALLGEVLKPVFQYRPTLEAIFQRLDPISSNEISLNQFIMGLDEMNRQLVADGGMVLTAYQKQAVAEIASGGKQKVKYRDFLRSLKVVDTVKREQMFNMGLAGLRAALSL